VADANRVQPTAPSPKKEVKSTPTAADSRVPSKSPATPAQKSQEKASVAANRLSNSGGVTRPRRENRQPPKHLREAFDQLESEGVNLKRMIPKATKLPAQIMEDAPAATEPASASRKSLPEKADEEMHTDDTGNSLPADSTVDTSKANSDDGKLHSLFFYNNFFKLFLIDQTNYVCVVCIRLDYDSDDSDNSEDDPERLWCVCREPHNNRFMICCDKCEDWFHGKCVGVTRGMGRELELKGLEWICPRCVRQEYASLYDTIIPQEVGHSIHPTILITLSLCITLSDSHSRPKKINRKMCRKRNLWPKRRLNRPRKWKKPRRNRKPSLRPRRQRPRHQRCGGSASIPAAATARIQRRGAALSPDARATPAPTAFTAVMRVSVPTRENRLSP